MKLHNFGTVLAFEVKRTLAKPQFWLATIATPLLLVALFGLIIASNVAAEASGAANAENPLAFTYTDASGVIKPDIASGLGGKPSTDGAADAAAVQQGRADLFIAYPADPVKEPTVVVGRDAGIVDNARYEAIASSLLRQSALAHLDDPTVASLAAGAGAVKVSTYKDGAVTPGIGSVVAPMMFLVMLYLIVLMLGNQMLNITVEEKENRVTEMILTTIRPTTLIVGKVIAVLVVGLVQMAVFAVPTLVLALASPSTIGTAADAAGEGEVTGLLNGLVLLPGPLLMGAAMFVGGLMLFTGMLVTIGSIMPTAKDASSAFAVVIVGMFLPVYAAALILAQPEGLVSRVLTFFPLTAPVTALLRNATGSLGVVEGWLALATMWAFAALFLALGVRLFRQGSISYDVRLPLLRSLTSILPGAGRAA